MKKYVLIIPIIVVTLLVCDIPGMTTVPDEMFPCHIRNISTSSGVYVRVQGSGYYLDPSPQTGIPVDLTIQVVELDNSDWSVERTIDSVEVGSGTIDFNCEKWLLIEGNSSGWSCTWSDEPWE